MHRSIVLQDKCRRLQTLSQAILLRRAILRIPKKIKKEQLKMYCPTKDIPVLMCTAALKDIREQEDVFLEKGIPVLYKPFDLDEFLHLLKKMLPPSELM